MAATGRTGAGPKAVIFDYSTMLVDDDNTLEELRASLTSLRERGVRVVSFSTHARNLQGELRRRSLPPVDLFVTSDDLNGTRKGSPEWVNYAATRLGLPRHHFFYVGDDDLDWKTAINSGTLFVHASWSKAKQDGVTALRVATPKSAYKFITHFFLPSPRWGYRLDVPQHGLHIRCLLNATNELACDDPPGRFTLQDIFTYENKKSVGGTSARDLLMIHAISNLYAEGLITSGTRFAVYPSSTPNQANETFTEFLGPAAKFFHGWLQEEMLQRAAPAPDTSKLRAAGRRNEVTFFNQCNTVIVNQQLRTHYRGKNIIVFDDFTTSGMSIDWARTLLRSAGAEQVTLVTFGKYGQKSPLYHKCFVPLRDEVTPFILTEYGPELFQASDYPFTKNDEGMRLTQALFRLWKEKQACEP
jgi:hypothetical protein